MFTFKGTELRHQFLLNNRTSLIDCIRFSIMRDGSIIGEYFAGLTHSGTKYISVTFEGAYYRMNLIRSRLLRARLEVVELSSGSVQGFVDYNTCRYITLGRDVIVLSGFDEFEFKEQPSLINSLWTSDERYMFVLNNIIYSGVLKRDTAGMLAFEGYIQMDSEEARLPMIFAFFFIERWFLRLAKANID